MSEESETVNEAFEWEYEYWEDVMVAKRQKARERVQIKRHLEDMERKDRMAEEREQIKVLKAKSGGGKKLVEWVPEMLMGEVQKKWSSVEEVVEGEVQSRDNVPAF